MRDSFELGIEALFLELPEAGGALPAVDLAEQPILLALAATHTVVVGSIFN